MSRSIRVGPVISEEAVRMITGYLPPTYPSIYEVWDNIFQGFAGYEALEDPNKDYVQRKE